MNLPQALLLEELERKFGGSCSSACASCGRAQDLIGFETHSESLAADIPHIVHLSIGSPDAYINATDRLC